MRLRIFIFIIFFCLIIGVLNCFAQTSIKAEVDKTTLTQDETFTYKLIITSSENKLPQPGIATFKGFNVISQAQSSTISFVEGTAKTFLVYAFILAPTKAGKFKIGPSSIKIKDKVYSTDSFEIEVKAAKEISQSKRKLSIPEEKILPEEEPEQSIPEENQTESQDLPQYTL